MNLSSIPSQKVNFLRICHLLKLEPFSSLTSSFLFFLFAQRGSEFRRIGVYFLSAHAFQFPLFHPLMEVPITTLLLKNLRCQFATFPRCKLAVPTGPQANFPPPLLPRPRPRTELYSPDRVSQRFPVEKPQNRYVRTWCKAIHLCYRPPCPLWSSKANAVVMISAFSSFSLIRAYRAVPLIGKKVIRFSIVISVFPRKGALTFPSFPPPGYHPPPTPQNTPPPPPPPPQTTPPRWSLSDAPSPEETRRALLSC